MKKILVLIAIICFSTNSKAQPIQAYGNYIKSHRSVIPGGYYNFEVIVYLKNTDSIPDSISFSGGGLRVTDGTNKAVNYYKSYQINLCNGLVKVIYITDDWNDFFPIMIGRAAFNDSSIRHKGKNVPDSINYGIFHQLSNFSTEDPNFDNNSSYFKDIPLITIEKGKSNVLNLFEGDDDNDSLVFEYIIKNPMYSIQNINGVKLNTRTGDLFIPNTLDTGYYTLQVRVKDYYVVNEINNTVQKYLSNTYFDFTLHVVNERLPYFNHFAAKIDQNGIYNVYTSPTAQKVNYQADFINPKGLGNYSIDLPSTKPLNKPPTVTTTKINDTLLHINIDVNLDSGFYPVYKDLPTSLSIIVTTTDSTGNCTQDLTSFYLTNNPTNSIDEIATKNKISIFPNPATTKLNVTSETAIKEIYIYDLVGKLIKQMNTENNKTKDTKIAIDELTAGIYIIQVVDEYDAKLSSKFIKE